TAARLCFIQASLQIGEIIVQEALEARAAEQTGIQQGGVIQPIFEDRVSLPHQCGNCTQVGHVTRGKQQSTVTPTEGCQLFLQRVVFYAVTIHQVRSTTAHTVACSGCLHTFNNVWMVSEAEVIVAAEREKRPTIYHQLRSLRHLQGPPVAVAVHGAAFRQRRSKEVIERVAHGQYYLAAL